MLTRLYSTLYFCIIGNMEIKSATAALAALAQESRLALFRLLVQQGEAGMVAGRLAEMLALPNATLSFHLKALVQAGLIRARQDGRFIYYNANFDVMNQLLAYLTENCCGGVSCASSVTTRTN